MPFFFAKRRARQGLPGKNRRRLETPKWLQFFRTSRFVSAMIGLLTLAFLITVILFSEGREEQFLEAGQLAPRSIYAQVPFSYPDEEATRTAKQAAADATPAVNRIAVQEILKDADLFGSQLDELGKLNLNKVSKADRDRMAQIWSQRLNTTLDGSDIARLMVIPNKVDVAQNVKTILQEIARRGITEPDQFVNPAMNTYTYAGEASNNMELRQPADFYTLERARGEYTRLLRKQIILEEKYLAVIEKATQNILRPNITYNEALTARMKSSNRDKVQPVNVKYDAGDTLIMRNERVTKRHLAVLKAYNEARRVSDINENVMQQLWGKGVVLLILFGVGVLVLRAQQFGGKPTSNREYAILGAVVVLQVLIARGVFYFADTFEWPSPGIVPFLIMPAFAPMLIALLTNTRRANLIALLSSFFLAILADNNFPILIYSATTGIVGVYMCRGVRRRSQILKAGLTSGMVGMLCAWGFALVDQIDLNSALWRGVATMSAGLITALATSSVLPVFEYLFKVTTDLRWLEFMDLNHPLLRRMFTEAPGTYHHSLSVANLAEAAAEAVGANSLQARVCSLFHDIGKLVKPEYFAENIRGKESPHDTLAPHMSALVIMAHVKEGVDMAIKNGLNREIIDVIKEHHGNSKLEFFYYRAKKQEADAREGSKIMNWPEEDVPRVEEESFRYPGPKPQTRESGIISLADAIEAASRSMVNPTPQKIETMIREMVYAKLEDGQLDECQLRMNDLSKIMESFTYTLINMLHARISYPKDENKDKPEKQTPEFAARVAS